MWGYDERGRGESIRRPAPIETDKAVISPDLCKRLTQPPHTATPQIRPRLNLRSTMTGHDGPGVRSLRQSRRPPSCAVCFASRARLAPPVPLCAGASSVLRCCAARALPNTPPRALLAHNRRPPRPPMSAAGSSRLKQTGFQPNTRRASETRYPTIRPNPGAPITEALPCAPSRRPQHRLSPRERRSAPRRRWHPLLLLPHAASLASTPKTSFDAPLPRTKCAARIEATSRDSSPSSQLGVLDSACGELPGLDRVRHVFVIVRERNVILAVALQNAALEK